MTRPVLALIASLALAAGTSVSVVGDDSADTQITLTCSNATSLIAMVDSTTLIELTQEIQALAADPTGLQCALSQDPSATPPTSWTVYDWTNGNGIKPRVSANSQPATSSGDGNASFPFKADTYTALLTTTDNNLTGDLYNTRPKLTDNVTVADVTGTFQYRDGGGCTGPSALPGVRLFFQSPHGAGTTGSGTTGFYTQFWWSNSRVGGGEEPFKVVLGGNETGLLSDSLHDPSKWSDFNGQFGDSSPAIEEAFIDAASNVKSIGLSFGGGSFFENGVTTSDGSGTFSSMFMASS